VKYGGSLLHDEEKTASFASDLALLKWVGIHPVVVHGGGNDISAWMKRIGKEPIFIEGLRYTDEETMELTEMVLRGRINSRIVAVLQDAGAKAIGLSGKDGGLLTAERIKSKEGKDLGLVGDVTDVDTSTIRLLMTQGYIPVVSPIARARTGETLNTNADNAAAALAAALKAAKLIYLTDVPGVMVSGNLLSVLDIGETERLIGHPDVTGGMIPKLDCILKAIRTGVKQVHIISGKQDHAVLLEMFTDQGIGTLFVQEKR
jgi:acetylglutamate kinase